MNTDRNLLFGVLALQMDLIDREQFIQVCTQWTTRKETPLGDLLVEHGWLTAADRADVERFLERKLTRHAGDVHASLHAAATPNVRRALSSVADAEVEQSLASGNSESGPSTVVHVPAAGGRYHILRPHAKGGLGEVFVAQDTELNRAVALKEIQERHADDPTSRTRFILEAEITGGLEHPGVVPVYGLGSYDDGRPFYAMRFIQGDNLKEAIDRFHAVQPVGFGTLAFRQLLGRFVAVCNAVAYAHSRGVLHRDLKPGNVMLGKYGETLVVDWGLAKAGVRDHESGVTEGVDREPTLRPSAGSSVVETQYGLALGTPAYMSPEQAAGRLDELGPASDVYSLGATLYCLLTGKAPVTVGDKGEVLRKVQRGEITPPRQVDLRVPAPLAAVCTKALALRPVDRYATPLELAAEIEHWLADEPVGAYVEPWRERAGRWVRRHRTLVMSAAAALVVLLLGSGLGAAVLGVKNRALATANEREREARGLAEERFAMAKEAVEKYLTRVTESPELKHGPKMHELRKQLLEAAVPFYEKLAAQRPGDREQEAERGRAFLRVANVQSEVGQHAEAIANYEHTRSIFQNLAAGHLAVPEYRRELATSHNNLGVLLERLGKRAEAETAFRAALKESEQLATENPAVPAYRRQLAGNHNNLSNLLRAQGKRAEAEIACRAALAEQQQLAAEHPGVPGFRRDLAGSHNNLGMLLAALGKRAEAETAFRAALTQRERLVADYPDVPEFRRDLATSCNNLGNMLLMVGKSSEGEAFWRAALKERELLAAEHPAVPQYRRELALMQGRVANQMGDHVRVAEAAERLVQAAVDPAIDGYNAAYILAMCVALAKQDAKQDLTERRELARTYADRAVRTLRAAVAAGYQDVTHMKKDANLDPLRKHPEFVRLVQELEKKAPSKSP